MNGRLLSLEGISGTGKTFYREQLEKSIKNRDDVLFVKEIFNEGQEGLNKKIFSALFIQKIDFLIWGYH